MVVLKTSQPGGIGLEPHTPSTCAGKHEHLFIISCVLESCIAKLMVPC